MVSPASGGPNRFWSGATFQKLILAAGIIVGMSFVLYSISVIILIVSYLGYVSQYVSSGSSIPVTAVGIVLSLVFLIVLGFTIIKVSYDQFRGRLRNGILMLPCVFAFIYFLFQGILLFDIASQLQKYESASYLATLTNDGSLIIAAGVMILIAAPLLVQKSQVAKVIGASLSVVIAGLLALYINSEATVFGGFGQFFLSSTSGSILSTTGLPGSIDQSGLSLAGLFLGASWAEISAMIIVSVGLLLWTVFYNRKEVLYVLLLPLAGVLVYGIGLAVNGFQDAAYLLNYASQISTGSGNTIVGTAADSYTALFPSHIQFLAVSFLVAGTGGIIVIIGTGLGLGIRAQLLSNRLRPNLARQVISVSPGARTCLKCGSPIREDDQFCRYCGARFA